MIADILMAIAIIVISLHQCYLGIRIRMIIKWLNRQEHYYVPISPEDFEKFTEKGPKQDGRQD